mmetsp:Transcript_22343/g.89929  ORF Transcript_22343/g.89929 Transcript_22343/m.89929 type:complete len:114 (-) Transcript_22343:236-577(-)
MSFGFRVNGGFMTDQRGGTAGIYCEEYAPSQSASDLANVGPRLLESSPEPDLKPWAVPTPLQLGRLVFLISPPQNRCCYASDQRPRTGEDGPSGEFLYKGKRLQARQRTRLGR